MNDESITTMVLNWLRAGATGIITLSPNELLTRIKAREEYLKGEMEWRDRLIDTHLANLKAAESQVEAIPVDALLAIEEIAPLVGRDVLGDPAAWMKAWDEVSPWLARLDMQRCQHEWVGQRQGGDPADAASNQWVVYCRLCGMERRAEDA